jgi:hypothetical protein
LRQHPLLQPDVTVGAPSPSPSSRRRLSTRPGRSMTRSRRACLMCPTRCACCPWLGHGWAHSLVPSFAQLTCPGCGICGAGHGRPAADLVLAQRRLVNPLPLPPLSPPPVVVRHQGGLRRGRLQHRRHQARRG